MTRVVVVSNRVPVPQDNAARAGGLAVALLGLMRERGGLWFGWSGAVTETPNPRPCTVDHAGVRYATLDLSEPEHRGYYTGYANGVLWPMLHTLPHLMGFRRPDLETYRCVNQRFAATLAPMLRREDLIWVQDYHLLALPAALREQGASNPLGFFLHVPFPSPDAAVLAPGIRALVRDLLAADLIGFQTPADRDHFAEAAAQFAGARRRGEAMLSPRGDGRLVQLGVVPVEIDAPAFARTAAEHARAEPAQRLLRSLGRQTLLIGVERLDPTKGLPERLEAFGRLLSRWPAERGGATFLQIAAPSREEVAAYRELRRGLDEAAGAINSDFGEPDWMPLRLVAKAQPRETVAGYMRLARVGVVTPLRDGMNLVAKEYVAAQDPADPGVLVLSRFAGAAAQLGRAALLVNPHDTEEMAEAMHAALGMAREERYARWRAAWASIAEATPLGWGEAFLDELATAVPAGTA